MPQCREVLKSRKGRYGKSPRSWCTPFRAQRICVAFAFTPFDLEGHVEAVEDFPSDDYGDDSLGIGNQRAVGLAGHVQEGTGRVRRDDDVKNQIGRFVVTARAVRASIGASGHVEEDALRARQEFGTLASPSEYAMPKPARSEHQDEGGRRREGPISPEAHRRSTVPRGLGDVSWARARSGMRLSLRAGLRLFRKRTAKCRRKLRIRFDLLEEIYLVKHVCLEPIGLRLAHLARKVALHPSLLQPFRHAHAGREISHRVLLDLSSGPRQTKCREQSIPFTSVGVEITPPPLSHAPPATPGTSSAPDSAPGRNPPASAPTARTRS